MDLSETIFESLLEEATPAERAFLQRGRSKLLAEIRQVIREEKRLATIRREFNAIRRLADHVDQLSLDIMKTDDAQTIYRILEKADQAYKDIEPHESVLMTALELGKEPWIERVVKEVDEIGHKAQDKVLLMYDMAQDYRRGGHFDPEGEFAYHPGPAPTPKPLEPLVIPKKRFEPGDPVAWSKGRGFINRYWGPFPDGGEIWEVVDKLEPGATAYLVDEADLRSAT